jgi:translocation and assembly module TamA
MLHIILTFICFLLMRVASAEIKICPEVIVHGDDDIDLSDTEKRMVCGDPKLDAYKNIPAYQAEFFFRGFLQSRGYLNPHFEIDGETLHVHVGKTANLKDLEVESEKPRESRRVEDEIERFFIDKKVTPGLLDGIESDGLSVLRKGGYPCAKTKTVFNVKKRQARLDLKQLHQHNFGVVDKEPIESLHPNAFERFYPFSPSDMFDARLLTLTEKRMLRAEVVQGTYFLEECTEEGKEFSLSHRFILGNPRTIRFGAGASTEVGPMARIRWSNNRYGKMASLLTANLQASFRSQSLTLTADNFFWTDKPRQSLLTQFEIVRESQIDYEELVVKLEPHMKWTSDSFNRFWIFTLGPSLQTGTFHIKETNSTRTFSTGSVEGAVQWTSHDYEYYDFHPQEGEMFGFNFDWRDPKFGFSDPLLKLESSYVKLKRISPWGRGNAVGGVRLMAATTLVPDDVSLISLPPSVKFYGGGSDDIRGFLLRTLPDNNGRGALSKAALKLELRKTHLFNDAFEGFAFLDNAYFSEKSWDLELRRWYSPGIGIRWLSPIGLIQSFIARGYATRPFEDFGNYYYVGLGGSF